MKKILSLLTGALCLASPAWATLNLNTATSEQLQTLNGIGPAKAQAIVDYRMKNGSFKSIDDLDKVPGFGKKTVDKLRPELSLTPPKPAPAAAKPYTQGNPPTANPATKR